MRNIVLLCAQGMSTGMLMNKMKDIALKTGYECMINAYSISQINVVATFADCVLVGPQIRYELDGVKKACPNIPVEMIDLASYGRLDGAKVLAMAKKMIGD